MATRSSRTSSRVEDYAHGADELHGAGGELRVEERRVSWEILDAWRDAAEECGIPKIAEFNRGDNFGNAYFQVNQRRGVRVKHDTALLSSRSGIGPNLTVLTHAHVQRVTVETRDGVQARDRRRGSTRGRIRGRAYAARREVRARRRRDRLAAASAALRHRPARRCLQAHGIPVVHDLPGVGANLHDHLQVRMMYKIGTARP